MIGKTQASLTEVTVCPVEGTEWDEASCSYQGDSRAYSQPSSCAIPRSHLRFWCVSRASLRPSVFELQPALTPSLWFLVLGSPPLLLLSFTFSSQVPEHGSPTQQHLVSKCNPFPVKPSAGTSFNQSGPVGVNHHSPPLS